MKQRRQRREGGRVCETLEEVMTIHKYTYLRNACVFLNCRGLRFVTSLGFYETKSGFRPRRKTERKKITIAPDIVEGQNTTPADGSLFTTCTSVISECLENCHNTEEPIEQSFSVGVRLSCEIQRNCRKPAGQIWTPLLKYAPLWQKRSITSKFFHRILILRFDSDLFPILDSIQTSEFWGARTHARENSCFDRESIWWNLEIFLSLDVGSWNRTLCAWSGV